MFQNHFISIEEASELTKRYRNHSGPDAVIAELFDNTSLLNIINQPLCVSIRIYFGLDVNNQNCLIIVGVDVNGNDLVNGLILEHGVCCPTICSQLNS